MEEEAAVKAAPVTRLRRRLSVELQDESDSPTPATPTKKRGRLAAKPQLDLIEENGVIESPSKRTTRKSVSRDAEADKTLTPSRRSTRIRSNTSLVDKEDDEKLTPGRRSTRVRSNTSLLAEIAVPPLDSPRAKRATRRASLLGSDNEGTLTPTKSRRTRKDSTSSIDVQATPATAVDVVTPAKIRRGRANRNLEDDANNVKGVIDKIPEEETSDIKSLAKDSEESSNAQLSQSSINSSSQPSRTFTPSPNTARKSPRLMLKKPQDQTSPDHNAKEINTASRNKSNSAVNGLDENIALSKDQPDEMNQTKSETNNIHDLSVSSTNLISNLDKKPKNKKPGVNKSTSAIDSKDQSKRFRTQSCTTLAVDPPSEDLFYSDNEKTKKKKQRKLASESKQGSNQNLAIDVPSEKHSSEKKKKKQNESIVTDSTTETTLNKSSEELGLKPEDTSIDSNKENELSKTTNTSNAVKCLFETNPATSIQSLEIIEDSDSGDIIKVTDEIKLAEDQCVPVVFPESVNSSVPNVFAIQNCDDEKPDDRSIEPMDIDETMPIDISLTEYNRSRNSSLCMPQNVNEKSNRKSSISIMASLNIDIDKKSNRKSSISKDFDKSTTENTSLKANSNKSPRKSSSSISQNVEHSDLQNKSTLVLSELNVSAVSETYASKTVKGDKSPRKSSISKDFDKSVAENTRSPRKSSISKDFDKSVAENTRSPRKSSISKDFDKSVAENIKSPRKSSISKDFDKSVSENTRSPRKSSISKDFDKSAADNTSLEVNSKSVAENTKSPRKSSISKDFDKSVAETTSLIASSKKSPRKSSISKDLDQSTQDTSKNVSLNDNSITKLITNGVPHKDPKKNALMPCLTSTPVQDGAAKKSQINTSTAITPVVENKIAKAKKVLSNTKNSTVSESTDLDDDSEDSSKDRNDLVDDEAMDAGDDYQSGDSQDEEERLYERVNEIVERGETLTSDEDISNDSDYEHDSFLVSSDQEDEELLSGSGDDLDMSDNELTMSKKSKKKFNDRKTKEQKTASREMYEARHQLSSQDVTKNGRSRIDSTLLDSGDDNKVPPKKNKRMRIESETSGVKSDLEKSVTQNTSTADPEIGHKKKKIKRLSESCNESYLNENETTIVDDPEIAYREIGQKKKKSKRLSESCNESALNENEMTIVADPETNLENDDPLVVKIKPEPKTPQKDFDMSTVHFTDREEVEQVEVQENVTMMKSNETADPLQASFDENDDESISENEEATKNFESILESLNNEHKLPIKSRDVSLNLPKDKSQKAKVPLIEELNITTTKEKAIKKAGKSSQITESGTNKSSQNAESGSKTNKIINIDESSSSSIDLKLLFSDESNDGDKGGNNNNKDSYIKTPDKYIPLKKCYGKTNLHESIINEEEEADTNSENLPFFIDTVGTYVNMNDETLVNSSTTQNKHKKNRTTSSSSVTDKQKKTTSFVEVEEMYNISSKKIKSKLEGASDDNKANISQSQTSKKQKSLIEDTVDSSLNSSKIKHKKDDSAHVKQDAINSSINLNVNKKNKNYDERKSENSFSVKSKKNKKVDTIQDDDSDAPVEISSKNNEFSVVENMTETAVETFFSKKKSKKNKKVGNSDAPVEIGSKKYESPIEDNKTETPVEATSKNKKVETSTVNDETAVISLSLDASSKKKSKKSKPKELTDEVTEINAVNEDLDSSIKANKKSKKGSQEGKKTSESLEVELLVNNKITESESSKNKKRKRRLSTEVLDEQECFPANHTKKCKIADSIDADDQKLGEKSEKHSKKKNKQKERLNVEQTFEPEPVDTQSKKRKKCDDDFGGIKSKVMKQDSLDEIHVPRLPDAILNQLDDKHRQEVLESKKSQVVSTTDFNVEPAKRRKNKPSNFLEESVFLNHYKSPVAKKQKPKTSLPKILPFIPVASTSDKGFTTNFQVKVLTGKMEFVAKAEKNANFKTDYLLERRNKKLRTYDLYKKHRNVKLSKF